MRPIELNRRRPGSLRHQRDLSVAEALEFVLRLTFAKVNSFEKRVKEDFLLPEVRGHLVASIRLITAVLLKIDLKY